MEIEQFLQIFNINRFLSLAPVPGAQLFCKIFSIRRRTFFCGEQIYFVMKTSHEQAPDLVYNFSLCLESQANNYN